MGEMAAPEATWGEGQAEDAGPGDALQWFGEATKTCQRSRSCRYDDGCGYRCARGWWADCGGSEDACLSGGQAAAGERYVAVIAVTGDDGQGWGYGFACRDHYHG